MYKDERAEGYKAPAPEKETGKKDELRDDYMDERADQPEFIGTDPMRFSEPAVIAEDDVVYDNDVIDQRKKDIPGQCDCEE